MNTETAADRAARLRATHPADPSTISFARSCFAVDGVKIEFSVSRSGLHSGPATFGEDEGAANAYARKTGRAVTRSESPRMVRIAWR